MKLNEAVYRSPKWLRNFVDYEINTGEDIKGEPSKKRQAKIDAERKRQEEEADRKRREDYTEADWYNWREERKRRREEDRKRREEYEEADRKRR
jgi:hypothetical protein